MIKAFKAAMASRTPEQEILFNRLVMGVISIVAFPASGLDINLVYCCAIFLACNTILYFMQRAQFGRPQRRWIAAIILDVSMAFAVMSFEPAAMAFAPLVLLWMILGNGFRFGIKYLATASILSTIVFSWTVFTADYWHENIVVGVGFILALLAIPAYCSTLIRTLSAAKDQAETASRAKSYFLASVSHELRTPLNAILGYGNHLKQMDLPRKQHEMIEASVLAGEHLLKLIEQLIHVAKTEAGSNEIKNIGFRPTDVMTEVRDIMAIRAEDKGLSIQLQAEAFSDKMVDGPEEIIRNILINLMGNAIKFTESGTISIRSSILKDGNDEKLCMVVSDTGIGIAQSAREKIFKPFQQADDSVMDRFGGTGLGLAICRQLTEQVGGTIDVRSEIGKGSEFEVIIPVKETADQSGDLVSNDSIHILSLGKLEPELLASAQSAGNYVVRHVPCASIADLKAAFSASDIDTFQIALIDEHLASQLDPADPVWDMFMHAEIAPVLVRSNKAIEFEDIALRAAFASIVPATPNFDELRSAIRIGCSFAKHTSFAEQDVPEQSNIITPKSVLVADDNRTNRNVLAAILESAGHKVYLATDGDEALDMLEQGGIDILLLDVNMPRLNGIDACRMWRQIEGSREHLPIIGVTADATVETEEKCLSAGMDLRITKPVDAKLLLNNIEKFCVKEGETYNPSTIDPLNTVVSLQKNHNDQMPSIDPTQMQYLASIGDAIFVEEMIESFKLDVNETLASTQKAVNAGDVHQFRFCAHAFKSSANNIGASILGALCAKFEKITEAEFHEQGHSHLLKIEAELDQVFLALESEKTKISHHAKLAS